MEYRMAVRMNDLITRNNTDEPHKHNVEWKKTESKSINCTILCFHEIQKQTKLTSGVLVCVMSSLWQGRERTEHKKALGARRFCFWNWVLVTCVGSVCQNSLSSTPMMWTPCWWNIRFRSVAQSCPTLCDPMNRSMPGLPVHHQLPSFSCQQFSSMILSGGRLGAGWGWDQIKEDRIHGRGQSECT